ncbi:MAG: putative DNA binding domain-containing protein [Anaerolineae bacterium]|nr:putative DNA binding domain-containing protein [Anaerolineae bacterium]
MTETQTYPTLENLLRDLDILGEGTQMECKASLWQLPQDLWETVSAFANTDGGVILLGVTERRGRFEVAGLLELEKQQHDLASGLRDMLNIPIPARVTAHRVPTAGEDRVVLSIYVPEALRYQKPIYVRRAGLDKGCYKRVSGEDMPCTEDDLARYFQDRALISPDMTPAPLARREELDPAQVRAFRQLLATQDPTRRVLAYDDDAFLEAYGALISDGEQWLPTLAGVLLFGTPELIRRCFPAFQVDLIEIEGTEWVASPTDRGASRSFQGPLLDLARDLLRVLRQEIPERFALTPGEVQRMVDPMYVALREALHNALMHQDYRIHRPTQVRRFADRLEIENPGASLKDPDRLGEPGSELRNPRIAQIFYEIGWVERKGTGIRAMQEAMEQLNLTPPTFESDAPDRSFRAIFYRHHFMDEDDLQWLETFRAHALNVADQKALVYARKTGQVDNAAYRSLNRVDTLSASRALTQLEASGLLQRSEQRRGPGVYYTLTQAPEPTPDTPDTTPDTQDLHLLNQLQAGTRLSKAKLQDLIMHLCRERSYTARALAEILQRNPEYLRRVYLTPLVQQGRLQRSGAPNDPNVTYKTNPITNDE